MRVWVQRHRRAAVLVGITLLVPVWLFVWALGEILSVRGEYRDQIDFMAPRIARLQGLIDHEDAIRAALEGSGATVANEIYAGQGDAASVSATLQAEARDILIDAGLEVTNSQVLPVRKHERHDYVGVKLVAQGDIEALDAALTALLAFRPRMFVETIDVIPRRVRSGANAVAEQTITVTIQLLSVRAAA